MCEPAQPTLLVTAQQPVLAQQRRPLTVAEHVKRKERRPRHTVTAHQRAMSAARGEGQARAAPVTVQMARKRLSQSAGRPEGTTPQANSPVTRPV